MIINLTYILRSPGNNHHFGVSASALVNHELITADRIKIFLLYPLRFVSDSTDGTISTCNARGVDQLADQTTHQ